MVIICNKMNVKDFLTATKQPFFSLRFVDLVPGGGTAIYGLYGYVPL